MDLDDQDAGLARGDPNHRQHPVWPAPRGCDHRRHSLCYGADRRHHQAVQFRDDAVANLDPAICHRCADPAGRHQRPRLPPRHRLDHRAQRGPCGAIPLLLRRLATDRHGPRGGRRLHRPVLHRRAVGLGAGQPDHAAALAGHRHRLCWAFADRPALCGSLHTFGVLAYRGRALLCHRRHPDPGEMCRDPGTDLGALAEHHLSGLRSGDWCGSGVDRDA